MQTVEYYPTLKKTLTSVTTWMNSEDIILSGIILLQKTDTA